MNVIARHLQRSHTILRILIPVDGSENALRAVRFKDHGIEQVVMGTRGLGTVAGLLLGPVATKVLHLVHIPVLLVS